MIDLLIVGTRQHVGEMVDAGVVRDGDLVPAVLLLDHVADELGVAAALGPDRGCEGGSVFQVRVLHARVEGQQVQHRDGGGAVGLAERVDPGLELWGELEGLGGRCRFGVGEGAG